MPKFGHHHSNKTKGPRKHSLFTTHRYSNRKKRVKETVEFGASVTLPSRKPVLSSSESDSEVEDSCQHAYDKLLTNFQLTETVAIPAASERFDSENIPDAGVEKLEYTASTSGAFDDSTDGFDENGDVPDHRHLDDEKIEEFPNRDYLDHFEDKPVCPERAYTRSERLNLSTFGNATYRYHDKYHLLPTPPTTESTTAAEFNIFQSLWKKTLSILNNSSSQQVALHFALHCARVVFSYIDLFQPNRDTLNASTIRLIYCAHILNHVLRSRKRILGHNKKLCEAKSLKTQCEFRDQGLTRPKVLILVPFRSSAFEVINTLIELLAGSEQGFVSNKKRLIDEFGTSEDQRRGLKPEDYETLFSGNTDDHFRMGIGVSKKTLKLFTDFYSSDIIIASPLGLRTVIDGEHGENGDYDFLSSIEILILDQADVLFMQNWSHVLHILENLHRQPRESHDVDFSRVRMWSLNGEAGLYRQSLFFSDILFPELSAAFRHHCQNYAGQVMVERVMTKGVLSHVYAIDVPQIFHRLHASDLRSIADARFECFVEKILPQYKEDQMNQVLVFIPSYFDYVRLRNYLNEKDMSYRTICEYTKEGHIARNRYEFCRRQIHFLLYTERLHFYRRFKIKGVRRLIFYQVPHYARFYSELCNMLTLNKSLTSNMSILTLYSEHDAQFLCEILGPTRTSSLLSSDSTANVFSTKQ